VILKGLVKEIAIALKYNNHQMNSSSPGDY